MTSSLPLAGLTVIDLSRVLAGPYATMVLADLGARVIKVERPEGGDDSRAYGPFSASGKSAYFTSINRAKESIALDLKNPDDRLTFEALLSEADILVENFRPGVMEKMGYSWDLLQARFPRLIYAATTGFGHSGPYAHRAAYDIVVQGMSGIMSVTGHAGAPPTRVGTSIGDITAGLFTVIAIQAALAQREKTGLGQFVDIAMLDCQLAILENAIARYAVSGVSPGPLGAQHPSIAPFGAFRTQDGHMIIAAGNDALWQSLCDAIHLAPDARFATNADRATHIADLIAALEHILTKYPTAHWLPLLEAAGIPCGPINDIGAALADPQVRARSMVGEAQYEDGALLLIVRSPIKLMPDGQDKEIKRAPALDEHGPSIRAALQAPTGALDADLVRLAHRLADVSGSIIRCYFRQPIAVEIKNDASPVTRTDRAVEAAIREILERERPEHGIIGEEFAAVRPEAEWQWVIDPIDGTRAFISGKPTFGTLIALLYKGNPVLGLIDQCILGDRWLGAKGHTTRHHQAAVRTRICPVLAKATIATTGPNYFSPVDNLAYERVRRQAMNSLWGGDCYNYGLLAAGHIDVVIESGLKLHDFAALVPVVEQAGGMMCDWRGAPLNQQSDGHVLALGDPAMLPEILAALAG